MQKSEPKSDISIKLVESLYDSELLAPLYIILQHIFLPPSTFFVSNQLIAANKVSEQLEEYLPRALSVFFESHLNILKQLLKVAPDIDGGWEIWSRVSGVDSPSYGYLHIDNDECLRIKDGVLQTPLYGSILYAGPNKNIEGGETAFLTSRATGIQGRLFSKLSEEEFSSPPFRLISSRAGRLVLFSGNIPHAVMWARIEPDAPRVTLLANYWKTRISSVPNGVCTMKPDEYKGK